METLAEQGQGSGSLGFPLMHVKMTIRDQVASVAVDQEFVNTSSGMIEVEYMFPVPPDAAIDSMPLVVNDFDGDVKVLLVPLKLEGGGKVSGTLPLCGGHSLPDEEELLLVHGEAFDVGPIRQVAIDADRPHPL